MAASSRTVTARSLDELEPLRSLWESARFTRLDPEIDYFSTVVEHLPGARPFVVGTETASGLTSLFVARVQERRLETRFGYRVVYAPRRRVLTLAHGGIFATSPAALGCVLDRVADAMRNETVDVLEVPAVRVGSDLQTALLRLGEGFRVDRHAVRRRHRSLELPPTWESFLRSRSKSVRAGARYTRRRVDATFGQALRIERHDGHTDLDRVLADLESIASVTYQRGLGAGFASSALQRSLAVLGAARGWFRAYLLYVDDRPSAFWQGWVHRRTYISSATGYLPETSEHRLGIYLLGRMIEDMCTDPDVDRLDFGFGDADYKRQYSSDSFDEQDMVIFAPTFRGKRTAFIRGCWSRANLVATNTATRLGADRRLKRWWRRLRRPDAT